MMGRPPVPLMTRFWSKVRRGDGCWTWIGAKDATGYGFIKSRDAKQLRAHRVAYENLVGPIPEGLFVCHRCDNRSCVNPDHLFLADHDGNMRDMAEKGRARPSIGEANGSSKLRIEDVRAIRAISGCSCARIAEKFGVTEMAVWKIRAGKAWRHVS